MQDILFVGHCILNTCAKVVLYNEVEIAAEEALRRRFLSEAVSRGVQLIQMPCPEFTLYGAKRWGHVSDQFDNVFFRRHARAILTPVLDQLEEYLSCPDRYRVLGFAGIDGSPSCGVKYTCKGPRWGGAFDGRTDTGDVLSDVSLAKAPGIFVQELCAMLRERSIHLPIEGLFADEPERVMSLLNP